MPDIRSITNRSSGKPHLSGGQTNSGLEVAGLLGHADDARRGGDTEDLAHILGTVRTQRGLLWSSPGAGRADGGDGDEEDGEHRVDGDHLMQQHQTRQRGHAWLQTHQHTEGAG